MVPANGSLKKLIAPDVEGISSSKHTNHSVLHNFSSCIDLMVLFKTLGNARSLVTNGRVARRVLGNLVGARGVRKPRHALFFLAISVSILLILLNLTTKINYTFYLQLFINSECVENGSMWNHRLTLRECYQVDRLYVAISVVFPSRWSWLEQESPSRPSMAAATVSVQDVANLAKRNKVVPVVWLTSVVVGATLATTR